MQFLRLSSALAVPLLATSAALSAQMTGNNSDEVVHVRDPQANSAPYTLTRVSTIVQTLIGGGTITRTFNSKMARDSEGRTYEETHETLHIRADGQPVEMVSYSVLDPVARTNTNWNGRTKVAIVTHIPAPKTVQPQTQPMQVPEADEARQPQAIRPTRHLTTEDLGVRTIAGVDAQGTRATGIIPAGEQGNDQPLTIVTENWISMQHQISLLTITDDPRIGKRTDEVTKFQAGEPDPSLFKIPHGYSVRERTAY